MIVEEKLGAGGLWCVLSPRVTIAGAVVVKLYGLGR